MKKAKIAIGIDLGTVNTCAGLYVQEQSIIEGGTTSYEKARFQIIENLAERQLLNYVTFKPNGGREFGKLAKNKIRTNINNTVFDAKLLIGQHFNEANFINDFYTVRWPFKIVNDDNNENRPSIKLIKISRDSNNGFDFILNV